MHAPHFDNLDLSIDNDTDSNSEEYNSNDFDSI